MNIKYDRNTLLIGGFLLLLLATYFFSGSSSKEMTTTTNEDTSIVSTTTTTKTTQVTQPKKTTTTSPAKPTPAPTQTTTTNSNYISIGQRVLLNGIYVTPVQVTYDSRCPVDVQCIQAGTVELGVLLENGGNTQNVIISLAKPFAFDGKTVTLTNVSPAKVSTKVITASEYKFLITVR